MLKKLKSSATFYWVVLCHAFGVCRRCRVRLEYTKHGRSFCRKCDKKA